MWASTLCPFSSSTRNMALGRGSTTVPSTSMTSSLATLQIASTSENPTRAQLKHAWRRARSEYTGRSATLSRSRAQARLTTALTASSLLVSWSADVLTTIAWDVDAFDPTLTVILITTDAPGSRVTRYVPATTLLVMLVVPEK